MKKSIFFSLVIVSCIVLMTACDSSSAHSTEVLPTPMTSEKGIKKEVLAENKAEVSMEVEGMVCAMGCAKFIENEVASLDGIVLSKVNFETGSAMFEYDKTTMSPKEIEKFINNIHDGQYSAKIAKAEATELEENDSINESEENLGSVSERIDNISLPKLFTFLIKRMR